LEKGVGGVREREERERRCGKSWIWEEGEGGGKEEMRGGGVDERCGGVWDVNDWGEMKNRKAK